MSTRVSLQHVQVRGGSWKNFSGEKTDFNDKGKRNFCAFLSKDQAEELKSYGVNVKERPPRDEDDDWTYYVKVNVNIESKWPPRIYICTKGGDGHMNEIQIDPNDVGNLDSEDIEYANLQLNLNETNNPRYGHVVTAYLNAGAFVISDRNNDNLFDWR